MKTNTHTLTHTYFLYPTICPATRTQTTLYLTPHTVKGCFKVSGCDFAEFCFKAGDVRCYLTSQFPFKPNPKQLKEG